MSRWETITIDRRTSYYARAAISIARDPLDFYTRAERGRKFQANIDFTPLRRKLPQVAKILRLRKQA